MNITKKIKITINILTLLILDIALIVGLFSLIQKFDLSILVIMVAIFGIGFKWASETTLLIKEQLLNQPYTQYSSYEINHEDDEEEII